ncbi:MAG TPA: hypothetical protein VLA82_12475, partial [Actinomycetota bacterium]|nr:hypothetical protein [Actinomycetota bacterium]
MTDPASPQLMSDTPCGGSQGDITMVGNLIFRSSDGSHNVPFADLNRACETSGNENQRVNLEGFDEDGDSFRLSFQGNQTIPIVRGQNNTTAGIDAALEGGNEQQVVSLTGYDTNGESFQLSLGGNTSIPIVRGTNNTTAGIQQALLGVDEVQTLTLNNFVAADDSFTITLPGVGTSSVLGEGGAAVSAANIQAAINGIAGFPGGVTVSGSGNGPYTITFAGASAKTNWDQITVAFDAGDADDCKTLDPACSATIGTTTDGRAALHPSIAGATIGVSGLSDNGFTLTFSGTHAQTDIGDITVVGSGDVSGTVRETVKGTPPVTGWLAGGTSTISNLPDAGFNVVFAGNYAAFDVPSMSVVATTGGVTGTVVEQAKGAPGAGFVGLYVFDATDLENPVFLKAVPVCGGGHTHTVYDDKANNRVVAYMTRSGTTGTLPAFGVSCAGLPANRLTAVTIPKSNPKAARIASENIVYPGSGGCHDANVFEEKQRILTACLGSGVSMLDISDPLNATTVWGPFTWPNHGTWHTGSWSWSGDYVYVNGEPGGGSASECAFDDHPAKPSVFALNADTGSLEGTWTLPRPQETTSSQSNCTVHNLNVLPLANKNVLAHSFYTAGASLIDFTNPQAPREVAFIDQILTPGGGGVITSGAGCWSAYWYNGTIFCNELSWGLHLFGINTNNLPWYADTMTLE